MKVSRVDGAGLPYESDLDELFAPRSGSDPSPPAPTGFVTGGADLNIRYKPLSSGTQLEFDTNFRIAGGADLRTLFAKLEGSPLSRIQFNGLTNSMSQAVVGSEINQGQPISTTATISIGRNGSTTQQTTTSSNSTNLIETVNGTWHLDAIAPNLGDDYELQFDDTGLNTFGTDTTINNNAINFVPITSSFIFFQATASIISGSSFGYSEVSGPLVIRIRHIATGTITTYTVNISVLAEPM